MTPKQEVAAIRGQSRACAQAASYLSRRLAVAFHAAPSRESNRRIAYLASAIAAVSPEREILTDWLVIAQLIAEVIQ